MNNNDRFLYGEEIISLLKRLNVITSDMSKIETKILVILKSFKGHFGNPYDRNSMENLFLLLEKFNVDLSSDKNKKILYEFIFNKSNGKKVVSKLNDDSLFKKINKRDASFKDIDNYVSLLVLELGFKPSNMGFVLFKEGVIYFYHNFSKIKSIKDVYLYLGNKYSVDEKFIERIIRQNLKSAKDNHFDNEVSRYIYGTKVSKSVANLLLNTISFINSQDEFIVLRENKGVLGELLSEQKELDNIIEIVLDKLNVSDKLVGYNYLVDLIHYVFVEEVNTLSWIKLYQKIANKYNKSISSVERDIRFLIDSSYFRKDDEEISKYVYGKQKRVSISQFVSNVIDYIKLLNIKNNMDEDFVLEQKVSYLLHRMGISSNVLGYNYLIDIIMLTLKEDGLVSLGKLYEEIGNKYGTNYSKVERGIRNVIAKFKMQFCDMSYEDMANNSEILDIVKFLYRYCDDFNNTLFISYVVQYIKLTNYNFLKEDMSKSVKKEKKYKK